MDKGAHFYRTDLQAHTPRDINWKGPNRVDPEERKAYAALFREELQLSKTTVRNYSRTAKEGAAKLEVISDGSMGMDPTIPPGVEVWSEIVYTDDKTLRSAAKKGLFSDYEVTGESIKTFKKTGQLPFD